jgi:hypothetical protein
VSLLGIFAAQLRRNLRPKPGRPAGSQNLQERMG